MQAEQRNKWACRKRTFISVLLNKMETSTEQPPVSTETVPNNEQEHNEEGMEETEDYSFDGEDYRHFVPRGRGGFRCVIVFLNTPYIPTFTRCPKYESK